MTPDPGTPRRRDDEPYAPPPAPRWVRGLVVVVVILIAIGLVGLVVALA